MGSADPASRLARHAKAGADWTGFQNISYRVPLGEGHIVCGNLFVVQQVLLAGHDTLPHWPPFGAFHTTGSDLEILPGSNEQRTTYRASETFPIGT